MNRSAWTAFLDRDGTINVKADEGQYIKRPKDLVLLPGAASGVAELNRAGFRVVVVTNQRGVAQGIMSASDLDLVHDRLVDLLSAEGAILDAIYACVHETAECDCRKPAPGLLLRAAGDDPSIDLRRAVMVGDAASDIAAGTAAGALTVALTSGIGGDFVAADLEQAVPWLLTQAGVERGRR